VHLCKQAGRLLLGGETGSGLPSKRWGNPWAGGVASGEDRDATGENGLAFEGDAREVDLDQDGPSARTCLEPV
jgi:hypothetical protein